MTPSRIVVTVSTLFLAGGLIANGAWAAAAVPAPAKAPAPVIVTDDRDSEPQSPAAPAAAKIELTAKDARAALEALDASRPVMDRDRKDDVEYTAVFRAQENLYVVTKVKYIGDLWRAEPSAPELEELMKFRWAEARRIAGLNIRPEVEAFENFHPLAMQTLAVGWYQVTAAGVRAVQPKDLAKAETDVARFVSRFPEDARGGAELYSALISKATAAKQTARRDEWIERVISQWPESPQARQFLAERRRNDAIGKPFELAFSDWLTGRELSMADFKGQVVMIDFWATWCGPCKAEMPHVKDLYKTYHDSGFEIIGVSLDYPPARGGGESLTKYCAENSLTWPQYYQGNYWDSEFSKSWGINGIPAVFMVDRQGILRSVDAREKLDELIPQLLAETVAP